VAGWLKETLGSLLAKKDQGAPRARNSSSGSAPYTRLSLDQGTAEWHAWRRRIIGASDAPVIMGENPWKSVDRLLAEKNGLEEGFRGNAKTRRGAQLEPAARSLYESRIKRKVPPAVLQRRDRVWQGASVDGIDNMGSRVVEIKCGESVYRHVARFKAPPTYYMGQLQHILAVTELDEIHLFCYWPGYPEIMINVPRDQVYIGRLIEKEEAFFKRVRCQ
jgi:putative phage-type endonuclease